MVDVTASLEIARATGGPLIFSGVDDDNPFGLLAMNEPAMQPRIQYAAESPYVSGALALGRVWQLAMLNAVISISATTQAELEALKDEVRTAIAPLSLSVTQRVNGFARVWSGLTGSLTQTAGGYELPDLAAFEESYNITIPVQPLEA